MPKNKNLSKVVLSDGDRLITTKQLADMFEVAENTITRARVYGTGQFPPYIKVGKSVRYRLSTVKAFLDGQQERQHTSKAA